MRVAVGIWQRFSQGSGAAGRWWELEVWGEGADGFVLEDSSFCCLVIDGGVWSGGRRTGEVGSEREEGPKVLLEGAPLKAASCQGKSRTNEGLPRISRS